MRCTYCGADIPEGMLYCGKCGAEVQIVPDYNPLDDVLAKQVKGSIGGTTTPLDIYDEERFNTGQLREKSRRSAQNTDGRNRQNRDTDGRKKQRTEVDPRVRKRQQMERKKMLAKKKRRKRMAIFSFLLIVAVVLGFLIYHNSYTGIVAKGNKALSAGDYTAAETAFTKAIDKNNTKADAYTGLSKVYIAKEDLDAGESLFLDAINSQSANLSLYEGAIQYYTDTKQMEKITELLDNCQEDIVLANLSDYIADQPEFSLDAGTYEDVQQVSLTSSGKSIYYTTDGSQPTVASSLYTEAILLNEGATDLKAISVNAKGVPSLVAEKKYNIEIPVADAPAITPSTGQYDTDTQISITVPTGYDAYYTLDGSDPSSASIKYSGPIDMPEGQTIFCAVLINSGSGKISAITKRNYVLEYE